MEKREREARNNFDVVRGRIWAPGSSQTKLSHIGAVIFSGRQRGKKIPCPPVRSNFPFKFGLHLSNLSHIRLVTVQLLHLVPA